MLLIRCSTDPAMTLYISPAMAWGSRWTATMSGESLWTSCMNKESQNCAEMKAM